MMAEDSGRVCIITGASSGIGEATALALGSRGDRVVLAARRADRLESLAETIRAAGGETLSIACDVADRAQVRALVEQTMAAWGRIDVLVNNAGVMPLAPMTKCRMDDWDRMIDVNLKGLLYGIGFALPIMLEQGTGHIVNVSSVAGRRIFPGGSVYCATKHGVHALSEGLREELADRAKTDGNRVRVTVIAPGVVRTELPDSITDDETREISKGYYDGFVDPLTSEDIADSILWVMDAPGHVNINEVLVRPTAQVR
jgi:NADP-dependent 3-hydroxy acid dehydrogenase YdfG